MFEFSISDIHEILQKSISLNNKRICSYRFCGDSDSIQIMIELNNIHHLLIFTKYGGDYIKIKCSKVLSSNPRKYILIQGSPLIDYLSTNGGEALIDFLINTIVNWIFTPDAPDISSADYFPIVDAFSEDCSLHICRRVPNDDKFPSNHMLEKVVHIPGKNGIDEDFAFSISATNDVILRYSRYSSVGLLEDLERSYNNPVQEIMEIKEIGDGKLNMSYLVPLAIPVLLMVEEIRKIKEKM